MDNLCILTALKLEDCDRPLCINSVMPDKALLMNHTCLVIYLVPLHIMDSSLVKILISIFPKNKIKIKLCLLLERRDLNLQVTVFECSS